MCNTDKRWWETCRVSEAIVYIYILSQQKPDPKSWSMFLFPGTDHQIKEDAKHKKLIWWCALQQDMVQLMVFSFSKTISKEHFDNASETNVVYYVLHICRQFQRALLWIKKTTVLWSWIFCKIYCIKKGNLVCI